MADGQLVNGTAGGAAPPSLYQSRQLPCHGASTCGVLLPCSWTSFRWVAVVDADGKGPASARKQKGGSAGGYEMAPELRKVVDAMKAAASELPPPPEDDRKQGLPQVIKDLLPALAGHLTRCAVSVQAPHRASTCLPLSLMLPYAKGVRLLRSHVMHVLHVDVNATFRFMHGRIAFTRSSDLLLKCCVVCVALGTICIALLWSKPPHSIQAASLRRNRAARFAVRLLGLHRCSSSSAALAQRHAAEQEQPCRGVGRSERAAHGGDDLLGALDPAQQLQQRHQAASGGLRFRAWAGVGVDSRARIGLRGKAYSWNKGLASPRLAYMICGHVNNCS